MYQTIFFDLDGTLSDPKPGIIGSIQYALAQMNQEVPAADELTWCIGPSLRESFKTLLKTDDDDLAETALTHYRHRFSTEKWMFKNTLYPGIPELLVRLKTDGWQLFIVTAKPKAFAIPIVDYFGLSDIFEVVYGPELDGHLGNKTDLLAHVVKRERLDPATVIMVGDRRHDCEAAHYSGAYAIGVTYGYGSREELAEAGYDELADDLETLYTQLSSLHAG